MEPAKLFRIILLIGIGISVLANLSALFDIVRLSEDELVILSFIWVFPIVYGAVGLATYKGAQKRETSVHKVPFLYAITSVFALVFFFVAIFPSL